MIKLISMKYITIMLLFFNFGCYNIPEETNPKHDIRIYPDNYMELIKAIEKEDIAKIATIVKEDKLELNFADSTHGISLLNWCIFNNRIKSFEQLLKLGANPNWQDKDGKYAPVIILAAGNSLDYLKLTLQFNGNPNLIPKKLEDGCTHNSPLLCAIFNGWEKNVKLLVEHGADVNLMPSPYCCPTAKAMIYDQMNIAKYLLDKGADVDKIKTTLIDSTVKDVCYILRLLEYPLNSDEYKIKMEIVNMIKEKGYDYWTAPIPIDIKDKYKDDPNYLNKY